MTKPRELYHDDITWVPKSELKAALKRETLLVEALEFECGNRCAIGLNQCNARETLEQNRKLRE